MLLEMFYESFILDGEGGERLPSNNKCDTFERETSSRDSLLIIDMAAPDNLHHSVNDISCNFFIFAFSSPPHSADCFTICCYWQRQSLVPHNFDDARSISHERQTSDSTACLLCGNFIVITI